jgi:V-type H+-transporting ATPase subunit a
VRISGYDDHNISRPTFIKTNEFTGIYQQIIDTYGIPRYLEANPAVLTIVTFPFFFGMMFGDMGHGSILFFGASVLVLFANSFRGTLPNEVLGARYLLLLMGLMAFYCGFIYNEFFAVTTNFFGSCYGMNKPESVEL